MLSKIQTRGLYLFFLIALLVIPFIALGCSSEKNGNGTAPTATPTSVAPTPISAPTPEPVSMLAWDPEFIPPQCSADGDTPLFDEALALTGLDKNGFGLERSDFLESDYYSYGYLSDEFLLSWLEDVRAHPARAGCFEGAVAGALDYYLTQPHPVAGMIRHAATLLDRSPDEEMPIDPKNLPGDFSEAVKKLCDMLGNDCGESSGQLPEDLAETLTPLIWAIVEGVKVRMEMDMELDNTHNADWWQRYGGKLILEDGSAESPGLTSNTDRSYLLGEFGRRNLYRAAAQIAFAIEEIDWSPFIGQMGIEYDLQTPAGWIRIRDGADHLYEDDDEAVLLLLDLGGNDRHLEKIASNISGDNSVSIAIDLSGEDVYSYTAYRTPFDDMGLRPTDIGGRYQGDGRFGNVSLSNHFRQGAARNGIAMLFDFGSGNDHYQSLRGSQGYAQQGVGVAFDEGGDDIYISEIASQGSAQFGIALHIDTGEGNDQRFSFSYSQGFGYVSGFGASIDDGGDDWYICDQGDPEQGGIPLYYTPQMAGEGNSSFCQGAGYGHRGNDSEKLDFLSGGVGVIRDIDGCDVFEASVFAQGAGFWQGTGIASMGGNCDTQDQYDAYYYVQGAAAHFAVGIFAHSGEGNAAFNSTRPPRYMSLGAGHDLSIGIFIYEKGDNEYNIAGLSAGASNCNGIGLFVDNAGNDTYIALSDYSSGLGNVGGCINDRPGAVNIGIMIDAGGEDSYDYPESDFPTPGEGKTWGHARHGLDSEYGAGIDGEGETGIHAGSGQVK